SPTHGELPHRVRDRHRPARTAHRRAHHHRRRDRAGAPPVPDPDGPAVPGYMTAGSVTCCAHAPVWAHALRASLSAGGSQVRPADLDGIRWYAPRAILVGQRGSFRPAWSPCAARVGGVVPVNEAEKRDFLTFARDRASDLFPVAYSLTGRQDAAERLLQAALEMLALRWRRTGDPFRYAVTAMQRLALPWWRRYVPFLRRDAPSATPEDATGGRVVDVGDLALAGRHRRRLQRAGAA